MKGTSWIEVSLPDGTLVRTAPEQVDTGESTFIIGGMENASGGMVTMFVLIVVLLATLLGYLIITGPRSEDEIEVNDD